MSRRSLSYPAHPAHPARPAHQPRQPRGKPRREAPSFASAASAPAAPATAAFRNDDKRSKYALVAAVFNPATDAETVACVFADGANPDHVSDLTLAALRRQRASPELAEKIRLCGVTVAPGQQLSYERFEDGISVYASRSPGDGEKPVRHLSAVAPGWEADELARVRAFVAEVATTVARKPLQFQLPTYAMVIAGLHGVEDVAKLEELEG